MPASLDDTGKVLGGAEEAQWEAFVQKWTKQTRQEILMKLAGYGLHDQLLLLNTGGFRESLMKSMRTKIKRNEEEGVDKIHFSFARHGFFIEAGVGRGHPKGNTTRAKMEWLYIISTAQIELIKEVVQYFGDEYIGAVKRFYGDKN